MSKALLYDATMCLLGKPRPLASGEKKRLHHDIGAAVMCLPIFPANPEPTRRAGSCKRAVWNHARN